MQQQRVYAVLNELRLVWPGGMYIDKCYMRSNGPEASSVTQWRGPVTRVSESCSSCSRGQIVFVGKQGHLCWME